MIEHWGGVEDFASDIPFEATNHLKLTLSLLGRELNVGLGPGMITKSDDNDAMESGVGLKIPTLVDGRPRGVTRRSG